MYRPFWKWGIALLASFIPALEASFSGANAQEATAASGSSLADTHASYLSENGLTVYAAAAEKWTGDISRLTESNKAVSSEDSILFIGSSTIRLWKTLEQDVAPHKTINRGYGGAKFCDLAIFAPQVVSGLRYRAAVMFVANDITGSAGDKEPVEIKRLARIVIESIQKENPKVPVILLSITATPSRFVHWTRIRAANRALETLSEELDNVHFLETEKHYLNEDGQPIEKYFVADRLHQTESGYQILGKIVREKLSELIPQS
jgi:lysophospholipase L1-like esterase